MEKPTPFSTITALPDFDIEFPVGSFETDEDADTMPAVQIETIHPVHQLS
jgi:hypothetical protein